MRLSEKTIELNFCAQLSEALKYRILWFGLTQKQEARAGYDAYARLGGRLFVLQFKASNYILKNGARRFDAPHHQLAALRALGSTRSNSVYYLFPDLGNTRELSKNTDLIAQSQLMDAGHIPVSIGPPTRLDGKPRKNATHYVDVFRGYAIIHSDPVDVRLSGVRQLLEVPLRIPIEEPTGDRVELALNADAEQQWFAALVRSANSFTKAGIVLPHAV